MKPLVRMMSPARRVLSLAVAAAVAWSPMPLLAAPAKKEAAAPATDGRTVAVMRFSGADRGQELREDIRTALGEKNFSTKNVAITLEDAAKRVKCRGEATNPDCLQAIGKWLNSSPKTAADFIVYGSVSDGPTAGARVVLFDIAKNQDVEVFESLLGEADLIVPIVFPHAVANRLQDHVAPPEPLTEAEQKIIAELDEPEKTPEELAAEREAIEKAQAEAAQAQQDAVIDTSHIEVDLKKDFKDFCREGPRRKRQSREEPKDIRPKCSRGPVWGYWQPRAWVALGLTVGAGVASAAFYGAALAAHGPYRDAKSELDSFLGAVEPCDPRRNPNCQVHDGAEYDALATEVSRTGSVVRRRAIIGDVMLGTTVLLGGVLAIIIFQDRHDAKEYIRQEKGLRAISDLRVGPVLSKDAQGMGVSFRF